MGGVKTRLGREDGRNMSEFTQCTSGNEQVFLGEDLPKGHTQSWRDFWLAPLWRQRGQSVALFSGQRYISDKPPMHKAFYRPTVKEFPALNQKLLYQK